MGDWSKNSKSHVVNMTEGDFYHNEESFVMKKAETIHITLLKKEGSKTHLKTLSLLTDEIIDISKMNRQALSLFLEATMQEAKAKNLLFSVHLKATMMKVSDPIIFGEVLSVYFKDVFKKYAKTFKILGINPNHGLSALLSKLSELPEKERQAIEKDIHATYSHRPEIAMVDSDKGITNLHMPNDVIIDASMPAYIRSSGKMWAPNGEQKDTLFVIPDTCYSEFYQAVIDDCIKNGAYDPTTMGSVSNVGLMAQKAEEYGSHDKTFLIDSDGSIEITYQDGRILSTMPVEKGDIWRMCQTKDAPIKNWVQLAIKRAKILNEPAIFWLDQKRAHDAQLIKKVEHALHQEDISGLTIKIMSPVDAVRYSLARLRAGKNTISVTGNVLRDYLTDLFPILELGTSAKMLSIVPLMNGGGLFETGAGGSAPKHVQQFIDEGHLRWDSLGEFMAIAASLEHIAITKKNPLAQTLAQTLEQATGDYLLKDKSPKKQGKMLDNRGSHFYLALYWAQALTKQKSTQQWIQPFKDLADNLQKNEKSILNELNNAQGKSVSLEGY
jgi:isocitrate dehydrogenase